MHLAAQTKRGCNLGGSGVNPWGARSAMDEPRGPLHPLWILRIAGFCVPRSTDVEHPEQQFAFPVARCHGPFGLTRRDGLVSDEHIPDAPRTVVFAVPVLMRRRMSGFEGDGFNQK